MNSLTHPPAPAGVVPPMSVPRRLRPAARLAWRTLRTGRLLDLEAFMDGSRIGMDIGIELAVQEFTGRLDANHDTAGSPS